jgi:hypothetical protein
MPRTRAIFEWIFGMEPGRYTLRYEATPDDGLTGNLLERRRKKEAEAYEGLEVLMNEIRDLRSLHRWLHSEHRAYTCEGWLRRSASPPDLVAIY